MDVHFELNGVAFVWDDDKAHRNRFRHEGVTFENAAEAFFDPFLRVVDASRSDEARDAVIGCGLSGRLLFIVHVETNGDCIRIVSARKATRTERDFYDS
jgi:uncharacterized DUF497 family protein